MIGELVADELRRRSISSRGARLDERDALLSVHDVQRLAFKSQLASTIAPTENFEAAEIDSLLDERVAILFHDFAYALAARVVDVISRPAALQIDLVQLIAEIPAHVRQMRHLEQASMLVIGIFF